MHSSHNAHPSNQNMKCSIGVALYTDVKCFWKRVDVEEVFVKKCKIFSFFYHSYVGALNSKKMKGSSWPELRLEILQLKIRSLVSELLRKIWKSGFGSRSRMVIGSLGKISGAWQEARVHLCVKFGDWQCCSFWDSRSRSSVRDFFSSIFDTFYQIFYTFHKFQQISPEFSIFVLRGKKKKSTFFCFSNFYQIFPFFTEFHFFHRIPFFVLRGKKYFWKFF